jgi:hypothetical protein
VAFRPYSPLFSCNTSMGLRFAGGNPTAPYVSMDTASLDMCEWLYSFYFEMCNSGLCKRKHKHKITWRDAKIIKPALGSGSALNATGVVCSEWVRKKAAKALQTQLFSVEMKLKSSSLYIETGSLSNRSILFSDHQYTLYTLFTHSL